MNTSYKDYFIELYGYISNINNNYFYGNIESKTKCRISDTNNCITYVIMEAGNYDLFKFIKSLSKSDNEYINKYNKFINDIYELLQFYKVNEKFIKTNNIFIHSDIKLENILYVKDKLKIIDFGISSLSNLWESKKGGTRFYYNCYYENEKKSIGISSPQFDIFSLIMCVIQFIISKGNKTITTNFYKNINNVIKIIENHKLNKFINNDTYLKILKLLCIGWIFRGINNIAHIDIIINTQKIKKYTIDNIENNYNRMDNIITLICNCETENIIKNIECNDALFKSLFAT